MNIRVRSFKIGFYLFLYAEQPVSLSGMYTGVTANAMVQQDWVRVYDQVNRKLFPTHTNKCQTDWGRFSIDFMILFVLVSIDPPSASSIWLSFIKPVAIKCRINNPTIKTFEFQNVSIVDLGWSCFPIHSQTSDYRDQAPDLHVMVTNCLETQNYFSREEETVHFVN